MKFKDSIKDWFYCSKSERNGTMVLVSTMMAVMVFNMCLPYFVDQKPAAFIPLPGTMNAQETSSDQLYEEVTSPDSLNNKTGAEVDKFFFNPNGLEKKSWLALGLSERQVNTIYKYEAAGGKFVVRNDLSKIYSIPESLFRELEPWIDLPLDKSSGLTQPKFPNDSVHFALNKVLKSTLELNSADTTELKKLKGIGSYFAKKIVEYREKLGGFVRMEQLYEVWKMRPGLADTVALQVVLDTSLVQKMNVNVVPIEVLKKHPYFSFNQANCIVSYREKHGTYHNWEEVKKSALMDETTFNKIKPYLKLE